MTVTPVSSGSILRDVLFFIKNYLSGAIPDPMSNRPTNQDFIMTSYPTRPTTYPLITIKDLNMNAPQILGFQSQAMVVHPSMEVRIWANTVATRDQLADKIFYNLKQNQIGAGSTSQSFNLHDFKLTSSVNVDDPDGAKSKIQTYEYFFVAI